MKLAVKAQKTIIQCQLLQCRPVIFPQTTMPSVPGKYF